MPRSGVVLGSENSTFTKNSPTRKSTPIFFNYPKLSHQITELAAVAAILPKYPRLSQISPQSATVGGFLLLLPTPWASSRIRLNNLHLTGFALSRYNRLAQKRFCTGATTQIWVVVMCNNPDLGINFPTFPLAPDGNFPTFALAQQSAPLCCTAQIRVCATTYISRGLCCSAAPPVSAHLLGLVSGHPPTLPTCCICAT